jgi:hypothetical protein
MDRAASNLLEIRDLSLRLPHAARAVLKALRNVSVDIPRGAPSGSWANPAAASPR